MGKERQNCTLHSMVECCVLNVLNLDSTDATSAFKEKEKGFHCYSTVWHLQFLNDDLKMENWNYAFFFFFF